MNQKRRKLSNRYTAHWVFGLGLIGLSTPGCGDETAKPQGDENGSSSSETLAPYGIRAFVGGKEVRFGPGGTFISDSANQPGVSKAQLGTQTQGLDVVDSDAGTTASVELGGELNGYYLLTTALAECGANAAAASPNMSEYSLFEKAATVGGYPWLPKGNDEYNWFFFENKLYYDSLGGKFVSNFDSCDDILYHEQVLLCAASKLEEVASTVEPLVWDAVHTRPIWYGLSSVLAQTGADLRDSFIIPPQKDRDRFIVRDLAIHVLAQLGRLDLETPRGATFASCDGAYAEVADTGEVVGAEGIGAVFGREEGVPDYFPPYAGEDNLRQPFPSERERLALSGNDIKKHAGARLEFKAKILRESGVLLKRLIGDSVQGDMAGAAYLRANATDPKLGNELYWGARTSDGSWYPYNSMAHLTTTLFGRLEQTLSPHAQPMSGGSHVSPYPSLDPKCSGYESYDLLPGNEKLGLPSALGEDWSARWEDRAIRRPSQLEIVKALDSSGIAMADSVIRQPDLSTVRAAITEQFQFNSAKASGITNSASSEFTQFKLSPAGASIANFVESTSDEDLRFGLDRSRNTFQQLTGLSAATSVEETGGLIFDANVVAGMNTLGLVVNGGFPREDATTDIMARLAGAQAASQCREWVAGGGMHSDALKGATFQNVFSLGEIYGQRLNKIRALVEAHEIEGLTSAGKLAEIGAAELRAWAGPGRVITARTESGSDIVQHFMVQGLLPKDLGVKSEAEMVGQLRVVYGEPWVADCAAGVRTSCPEDFNEEYVPGFQNIEQGASVPDAELYVGSDNRLLSFQVKIDGVFQPPIVADGAAADKYIYVVSKGGPDGRGYVLAAFKPNGLYIPTSEVVSRYRRELANKALGVSPAFYINPHRFDFGVLSKSPDYCVENVPHDFFVPLESELTSDSNDFENSWKHYLQLADLAAKETDLLGQELINRNLAEDEKKQGAREKLGELCGSYAALNDLSVKKGQVVLGENSDSSIADCLGEDKYDLVFITNDPFINLSAAEATCRIKDYLGCERGAADPVCGTFTGLEGGQTNVAKHQSDLCNKSVISHVGLNLGEWSDPRSALMQEEDDLNDCSSTSVIPLDKLTGNRVSNVLAEPWASQEEMASTLASLKLVTADNVNGMHWYLFTGQSQLLLSSDPAHAGAGFWPACAGQPDCGKHNALRSIYDDGEPLVTESDLANLRGKIQSDLWVLAAYSGVLPKGLFNMPLPALNIAETEGVDADIAPMLMWYGAGQFTADAAMNLISVHDDGGAITGDDRAVMKRRVSQIQPAYAQAMAQADSSLVAPWVKSFYSRVPSNASYRFLHVIASNEGKKYKNQSKTSQFRWLTNVADELSGSCRAGSEKALSTKFLSKKYPEDVGTLLWNNRPYGLVVDSLEHNLFIRDLFKRRAANSDHRKCNELPDHSCTDAWGYFRANFNAEEGYPCRHEYENGSPMISASCLADNGTPFPLFAGDLSVAHYERWTRRMLSPRVMPPSARVQAFTNPRLETSACQQAGQISRALSLACFGNNYSKSAQNASNEVPTITSSQDLKHVHRWLARVELETNMILSGLMFRDIPKRAVNDQISGSIGSGSLGGQHGVHVLEIQRRMAQVALTVKHIAGEIGALKGIIELTQVGLAGLDIANKIELEELAIKQIEHNLRMAQAVISGSFGIVKSLVAGVTESPTEVVGGFEQTYSAIATIALLSEIENSLENIRTLKNEAHTNRVAEVLLGMQVESSKHHTQLASLNQQLRDSIGGVRQATIALEQTENQANYIVAHGLGSDYYMDEKSNQPILFPVNTVNRRLKDATEIRYFNSLRNSKYLAYMARLAIEQRIGQRLNAIQEPVGPLDAPSKWADDVCQMTGVDYKQLSHFEVNTGYSLPEKASHFKTPEKYEIEVKDFVDQFIGDYVNKLGNFVEYYNIKYPSHEGDDTAVISLRDDLLRGGGQCFLPSKNMLLYSSELDKVGERSGESTGWLLNKCSTDDLNCLRVVSMDSALDAGENEIVPPASVLGGKVSVFREHPVEELELAEDESLVEVSGNIPGKSVAQNVYLERGTEYILSWYDYDLMSGGLPAKTGEPYSVFFMDEELRYLGAGWRGSADASWTRRSLAITPEQTGWHWLVVKSSDEDGDGNAVGLTGLMLERASEDRLPSAYQHNTDSDWVLGSNCMEGSPQSFRDAFQYQCDETGCFYELRDAFIIRTQELAEGGSKLARKLARGNFNFRHKTVSLNVVGTGVLDCSLEQNQSCYATGVLDFDLRHDASQEPVINWLGQAPTFNFGHAAVRNGKALAAERYITLPISSTDLGLLNQPQSTKPEFMGRPLGGRYQVRIYDTPSLAWHRVEDIQLILNYRYWSKVERTIN